MHFPPFTLGLHRWACCFSFTSFVRRPQYTELRSVLAVANSRVWRWMPFYLRINTVMVSPRRSHAVEGRL